MNRWQVWTIDFDGTVNKWNELEPDAVIQGNHMDWVRLVEAPDLVIDEWHGHQIRGYDQYFIAKKET